MIKFKLDELLFKKGNIKVSQAVAITGINKNTLYAIYKGDIKRIDTDTLEKLCRTLECEVSDIIEFQK